MALLDEVSADDRGGHGQPEVREEEESTDQNEANDLAELVLDRPRHVELLRLIIENLLEEREHLIAAVSPVSVHVGVLDHLDEFVVLN